MSEKPDTMTFNVGDEKFEVTSSLLDSYPNSLLSKLASDRWLRAQRSDIDIRRD